LPLALGAHALRGPEQQLVRRDEPLGVDDEHDAGVEPSLGVTAAEQVTVEGGEHSGGVLGAAIELLGDLLGAHRLEQPDSAVHRAQLERADLLSGRRALAAGQLLDGPVELGQGLAGPGSERRERPVETVLGENCRNEPGVPRVEMLAAEADGRPLVDLR
jgi:hypothetical protein